MKQILEKCKNICSNVKRAVGKVKQSKPVQTVGKVIRIPFVGYLLLALALNFVLEVLSRHSVAKVFTFIRQSPMVYLYNAFIIFVTLSLVLFAKRKWFATIFVCVAWTLSAFANWIVLCFRTTPFSAIDVLMIRNVMTMLDKYMTKWQMVFSVIGIALIVLLLIYLYIRLPKSQSKRRPFRASAYVCMCIVLVIALTKVAVETKTVSDNFGNLAYAYNDYGFAYCFSNSIVDTGISKPRNYSEETVKNVTDKLHYDKSEVILQTKQQAENPVSSEQVRTEGDVVDNTNKDRTTRPKNRTEEVSEQATEDVENGAQEDTSEAGETEESVTEENGQSDVAYFENKKATRKHPNVIVIQLESIFDTRFMKDFHPSEDPTPTLTWLKENYSTGLFTVPAVGAGTANTEFEVQTGMSTQFFGAGEYPFKTIMRRTTCDSMAYDLKRQGYATAGFHNNDATFYERYIDYSNLGFDVFSGMEHMYSLNYTPRGWAKDNVLDDIMVERMRQTEGRDYITTITVQAHGRYPKRHTKTMTDLTCYFSGKYEGDTAKEAAWEYYINMCRETDNMIADLISKLNNLNEPTVVFMYGDHLPSLNLEQEDLDTINLYQTEWVMWDNIGLEREVKDMTAYQASTYMFNRLGLKGGLMQNFHNAYMNEPDYQTYMSNLELLEYDTLYGNRYSFDGENPFPQTDMKMGLREISVSGYEIRDDKVRILGKGFNQFSEVYVDGKSVDTKWVNYMELNIPLEELKKGKELYVAQVGDDHVVLSVTNTIPVTGEKDNENATGNAAEGFSSETSELEDNPQEETSEHTDSEASGKQ